MKTLLTLTVTLVLIIMPTIYAQELALVRQNDVFGYIDKSGNYVIEPSFEEASSFSEGLAAVLDNDKWGFINSSGEWVVEATYDRVKPFNSGLALVFKEDQWNYINKQGEILETPVTEKYYDFQNGVAFLRKGDLVGLINTEGKVILEPKYELIKPFENGHARVEIGDLWGLINIQAKEVVPVLYDEIGNYHAHGIWARKSEAFGLIIDGVFKPIDGVEKIWDFTDGSKLTYARSHKKIGFIDQTGNWAIEATYDKARAFNNGLAPVAIKNKWGYIDSKGNQVIDFIYKDAEVFSDDGLAAVKIKDWGFINTQGELIIPDRYGITASFSFFKKNQPKGFVNGLARVKYNRQWGFLTKDGNVLGDQWFQNAELFSQN